MTQLDTSAYTPAQETENGERTRYQIPLDTAQEENLVKDFENLKEKVRQGTQFYRKLEELEDLLNNYDVRRFLKMYQYECDKCGEIFDTKQAIGVHHKMNPNCNGEDRPWNTENPSYTRIRVDDR